MALAIGSLGINITIAEYFARIHPKVLVLAKDHHIEIKQNLIRSLVMIGKVKKKIVNEKDFLPLFFRLLIEMDKEERQFILQFFEIINFSKLIPNFEYLINDKVKSEVITDILSYFSTIVPNEYKVFDQSPIIQTLLQNFENHPDKVESYVKFFTNYCKFSLFGFLQTKIFLHDSLEYKNEIIHAYYIDLRGYYAIKLLKISANGENINNVIRLPNNFPKIDQIVIDEIKSQKKSLLKSLELSHSLPYFIEKLTTGSNHEILSTLNVVESLFEYHPALHSDIYPILLSIRNINSPEIRKSLIYLFIQFALSHPDIYLNGNK